MTASEEPVSYASSSHEPTNNDRERASTLASQIRRADYLYYGQAQPEISDSAYDALMVELRELEAKCPSLITPDSPTQRVGAATAATFEPVTHRVPMLSLDNAFGADELTNWDEKRKRVLGVDVDTAIECACELKIDGLSVSLTYENGRFVQGATRSDAHLPLSIHQPCLPDQKHAHSQNVLARANPTHSRTVTA